jgi:hypothetical protein
MSPPWITNFLTSGGSALLGAFVGGAATYLIGYKQRIYELRRDAYLAFIELRITGSHPSPKQWTKEPLFSRDLLIAKYKIELIGSEEIKEIVNEMVGLLYPDAPDIEEKYKPSPAIDDPDERWKAFAALCDEKLKPTIQKELEEWWPFERVKRKVHRILRVEPASIKTTGSDISMEHRDENGNLIKAKSWWQFWR